MATTVTNTAADRRAYTLGWQDLMMTIWQERLRLHDVGVTGALESSFQSPVIAWDGDMPRAIEHSFLLYGLYVEAGVGNGYRHGNRGDLGFTPNRVPAPWFRAKYRYSVDRFSKAMTGFYGRDFLAMIIQLAKQPLNITV